MPQVLPIDADKQEVRKAAWMILNLSGLLWLADLAGLLPWDTTPYNSLAEKEKRREEKSRAEARGDDETATKLGSRLTLFDQLRALLPKRGEQSSARSLPSINKDEALRRVLGLATWDAAEELKNKRQAATGHAQETMVGLKDNLRPRELERKIIDARPYELERKIIDARPYELERKIIEARPRELEKQVGSHQRALRSFVPCP